jgi:hypothetical protein
VTRTGILLLIAAWALHSKAAPPVARAQTVPTPAPTAAAQQVASAAAATAAAPLYRPIPKAPTLVIDRVDPDGSIKPLLGWKVSSHWVWANVPQPGRPATLFPFLYLDIEAPAQEAGPTQQLTMANLPLPKKDGKWRTRFTPPALSLRRFSKGSSEGLVVRSSGAGVSVHESCEEEQLEFKLKGEMLSAPGWIGLHCKKAKDGSLQVEFHSVGGLKWKEGFALAAKDGKWAWAPLVLQAPPQTTPFIQLKKPANAKAESPAPFAILRIDTPSIPGRALELGVFSGSGRKSSRFKASVGASTTFLHYFERATSVNFYGLYGSLKATASFEILPWLSIGGNVFGTVTPTYMTRADLQWPWFVGANARVGFTIPWTVWSGRFGISVGYYFWSMIVPDRSYGLSYVAGPQVFLTYGRGGPGVRAFSVYFKYAPLAGGDGINLANRDLAAGAALQVNSPQASIPVLLNLDLDHFELTSFVANNYVSVATLSLGVSLQF